MEELMLDPIAAVHAEVRKLDQIPHTIGALEVKSANTWIQEGLAMRESQRYFMGLVAEGEATVMFAATGVGKSVLGVQIAEEIAEIHPVLYLDLELGTKQFQIRYTDESTNTIHQFPQNFYRAELDPSLLSGDDYEQQIFSAIEIAAQMGIQFIIVDNLSFLCVDAEKGLTAGVFMKEIVRIKKQYGLTILVLSHTPKGQRGRPLTTDALAGSAKLMNFFDSALGLAKSAKDGNLIYLKEVKARSKELQFGADNVLVFELLKDDGMLRLVHRGYAQEKDHLDLVNDESSVDTEIQEVLSLHQEGKSIRAIANELGMSIGKVQRRLKRGLEQKGLSDKGVSECIGRIVSDIPIHPGTVVKKEINEMAGGDVS